VRCNWSTPVIADDGGTYSVAIRMPAWETLIQPGSGPAVGGQATAEEAGSYVASTVDGTVTPINIDLAVELLITPPHKAQVQGATFTTFLARAFPNPLNPNTTIEFGVERTTDVSVTIYSVAGRLVRELRRGVLEPGTYHCTWNGIDAQGHSVAAGVYFLHLRAGSRHFEQRLVVVK
jgi:FlgD Ig-like domain